jgi:hypothetical protein
VLARGCVRDLACDVRQNASLLLPLHRRASGDESSRNGTGEIAMHAVLHSLHSFFDSLLNSPYRLHLVAYAGIVAALLVGIPLTRALFRKRRKNPDAPSLNIASASPSMLGLSSPPPSPSTGSRPALREFTSPSVSKVTAINQSLTAPCIHCGVTMSSRQDFCPACGYAQPVKQGVKAAFPA